jgi:hypothetical protein
MFVCKFYSVKRKFSIIYLIMAMCHIASAQQVAFYKQFNAHKLAFISIATVHDGGCIVAGGDLWGPNGGNYFYLKTDVLGNEMWRRAGTFFTGAPDSSNTLHDVIETYDHKFLLCGELTTYSPDMTHILILCVDSLGGIIWSKLETAAYPLTAYHLAQLSNGDFFIVGNIYDSIPKLYIEKRDVNGDTIWTKKVSFYPYPAVGLRIIANGGFLYASGNMYDTSITAQSFAFLTKLDTAGNLIGNVQLIDSISINPTGLYLFDSIIYLPTFKLHFNGPESWIAVFDTSLNQLYSFNYPAMETCNFIDKGNFMGTLSGITFYRGDSVGDSLWSYFINEEDGGIRSIVFDSIGYAYACGAINDGVSSVGLIIKLRDSLITSTNETKSIGDDPKVVVYPNPTGRQVTIKLPEKLTYGDCLFFTLYDSTNKSVYSIDNIFKDETVLDLVDLPSAIYHYTLSNKNIHLTGKIIIN